MGLGLRSGLALLVASCHPETPSVAPVRVDGETSDTHDADERSRVGESGVELGTGLGRAGAPAPSGGDTVASVESKASSSGSSDTESEASSSESVRAGAIESEPDESVRFEPTWEWALTIAPELAGHSQESRSPEAFERFSRWFAKGPRTIHLRLDDHCFEVRGSVEQGFSYRETVTTEGNVRTRTAYDLQIGSGGITETGPGGTTYERDGRGRWQEVGGFGTGCFDVLVHDSISVVERGVAYFDAYGYSLTAECRGTLGDEQRCEDGSTRTCRRCSGIVLRRHAPNRGWGIGPAISMRHSESAPPVDCSQPCPADEWTPHLEGLNEVLAGRRFFDEGTADEGVLYLRGKDCRRAVQRVRRAREAG